MNKHAGISAWLALGIVLACLSTPGFSASTIPFFDGFENATNNRPLAGWQGWGASNTVSIQTNVYHSGSNAVVMGAETIASNNFSVGSGATNAWTDFWVRPAFYTPANNVGPAVDPNCSAQFYINSNGYLVVVQGTGGAVTNVVTTNMVGSAVAALDSNVWVHISVLNNYGTKRWAIVVNDQLLRDNLAFISTAETRYKRFYVYNGGATNTWLDDVYVLTNQVPSSLSADHDGDGMIDAWELTYFGISTSGNGPNDDPDGDGQINSLESANRTDPLVPGAPIPHLVNLPFSDYFDPLPSGDLYGQNGWNVNPFDAAKVQIAIKFQGQKAVGIGDGELSLDTYTNATYTNVWTAFAIRAGTSRWSPTLKPESTVAFYVGSDGYIKARNGGTWISLTNFLGGFVTNTYAPINSNDWVRFIINSDYQSYKWSLWMVTNLLQNSNSLARLVARDLDFGAPAASFLGLSFTNRNPENVTGYLDNVDITLNKTEWVDSDGDGVPDIFEVTHGMDPINPTNDANDNTASDIREYSFGTTNAGAGTTNLDLAPIAGPAGSLSPNNVRIGAVLGSNRLVTVMYSTSPTGPFSPLSTFFTGPQGETNSYIHNNAVQLGDRYYYYLTSRAPYGDAVATDTVVRVMHRQARPTKQTWYMAGVPVDYGPGSNNFGSTLGAQLARGLMGGTGGPGGTGDRAYVLYPNGTVWTNMWLDTSGIWHTEDGSPVSGVVLNPGFSVWIERRSTEVGSGVPFNSFTNTVLCGVIRTNASYTVSIQPGWNMLSWPYEQTRAETYGGFNTEKIGWGFYNLGVGGGVGTQNPNTADLIWVRRSDSGAYDKYYLLGGYGDTNDGRWWKTDGPNRGTYADLIMRPGNAFFYYHRGAGFTWTVTRD